MSGIERFVGAEQTLGHVPLRGRRTQRIGTCGSGGEVYEKHRRSRHNLNMRCIVIRFAYLYQSITAVVAVESLCYCLRARRSVLGG